MLNLVGCCSHGVGKMQPWCFSFSWPQGQLSAYEAAKATQDQELATLAAQVVMVVVRGGGAVGGQPVVGARSSLS